MPCAVFLLRALPTQAAESVGGVSGCQHASCPWQSRRVSRATLGKFMDYVVLPQPWQPKPGLVETPWLHGQGWLRPPRLVWSADTSRAKFEAPWTRSSYRSAAAGSVRQTMADARGSAAAEGGLLSRKGYVGRSPGSSPRRLGPVARLKPTRPHVIDQGPSPVGIRLTETRDRALPAAWPPVRPRRPASRTPPTPTPAQPIGAGGVHPRGILRLEACPQELIIAEYRLSCKNCFHFGVETRSVFAPRTNPVQPK